MSECEESRTQRKRKICTCIIGSEKAIFALCSMYNILVLVYTLYHAYYYSPLRDVYISEPEHVCNLTRGQNPLPALKELE